ncbi:tRNA (adenosine(37)-N6)-threonylcarbamoyltransferase complex dimerization subunit type 1 TsaB [Paraglaciecola psychrophila]|jgi:tRNA threonylcarbamoyladenosine biosynthesis protein TsaB|uniref:tRNA threonylcarbamoyladenosine biosynthesis protein TsaB n=1 Tax=Paraglaciecola psychrophila 170 TaxID=1129794 RepID=K6YU11_9ALTE|nr:tRNA (adenosine(37)-N6)-threonylcarbamoyltransferase complex dimerization subunit type 1 TsaB [Paraglaciecola psychrophila]AGH44847.1 peptidase M22, glycoprotease [Paraglaciecola psychrophila 170]GAC36209.1 peptidase M22, glycoprotease [Paraglaciecola psychrophila 170]
MNILIIDTATEACSVALEVNDQIFKRFEICPQQHSQRILPMIDEVLKEANVTLQDLDYLAFGRGPGSFTGVRIATGVLQGLALGTGHKVVGISTLAAMAQQGYAENQTEQVTAAIDARMSEVYFGQYQLQNNIMTLIGEEQVIPPQDAALLLKDNSSMAGVGTGWQAYSELNTASKVKVLTAVLYPNALYMLPLAKALIAAGQAVEVEDIQPVYLRDKVTWKKLPGRE